MDDDNNLSEGLFHDGKTDLLVVEGSGLKLLGICDASNPFEGGRVETDEKGTTELSACEGAWTVLPNPNTVGILTCGSLTVDVEQRSVEVPLPEGSVEVPAGATAELNDLGDGSFSVENSVLSAASVNVTAGGATTALGPGESRTVGTADEPVPEEDAPRGEVLSLVAGGQFIQWSLGGTTAAAVFATLKIAWLFNATAVSWTSFVPQLGVTDFPLADGAVLWLVAFEDAELLIG